MESKETLQLEESMIIFGGGVVGKELQRLSGWRKCFDQNEEINEVDLDEVGRDEHFIIATSDYSGVVSYLSERGFSHFYPLNYALSVESIADKYVRYMVELCMESQSHSLPYLRSVDLVITQRCTLKCRDCSNLMHHYRNPKDYNYYSLRNYYQELLIKYSVGEWRIIGGEPLINKDCGAIAYDMGVDRRVNKIAIYTNGTLLPKNIDDYKSPKVCFVITDYGKLSTKLEKLVKLLKDNGITYVVNKAGGWTNCGEIREHNRTAEENRKLRAECCAKKLYTLIDGKLYNCPFEANLNNLQKVDGDACDYCNGRPYNAPTITPALQRKK